MGRRSCHAKLSAVFTTGAYTHTFVGTIVLDVEESVIINEERNFAKIFA